MTGAPPVQRLGEAVLLQGPAVADVAYLVEVGLQAIAGRDQVTPHARWLVLQRGLRAVATDLAGAPAISGNAALPQVRDQEQSAAEVLTTKEAAMILHLQERQVRNLAPSLGGRRIAGRLLLNASAVRAEAAHRTAARRADKQ